MWSVYLADLPRNCKKSIHFLWLCTLSLVRVFKLSSMWGHLVWRLHCVEISKHGWNYMRQMQNFCGIANASKWLERLKFMRTVWRFALAAQDEQETSDSLVHLPGILSCWLWGPLWLSGLQGASIYLLVGKKILSLKMLWMMMLTPLIQTSLLTGIIWRHLHPVSLQQCDK